MPRAILKNGAIYPLEPLPPEWEDCARMQAAIDELRREAKEQARREMGLPDEAIIAQIDSQDP